MRKYIASLILTILAATSQSIYAQFHYRFENFTADDGLSDGWVKSILHDSKGFIWIATLQGIDRYDGLNFKTFPISAASLHEDKEGKIWIISDSGLSVLDPETEQIESYKELIDSLGISLRMNSITEDDSGNLWITTIGFRDHTGGLVLFNKKNKTFKKFTTDGAHGFWSSQMDEHGNLWLGGNGIYIFDPRRNRFIKSFDSKNVKEHNLPNDGISSLFFDKHGSMWAGTWDSGLSIIKYTKEYDLSVENIRRNKRAESLVSDKIFGVTRDSKGKYWIATFDGVSIYDRTAGTFQNLTAGDGPYSIQESRTHVVFEDHDGTIWMGHSIGLTKVKPNKGFIVITSDLPITEKLRGRYVSSVHQDPNGAVWTAVPSQGIHRLTFKNNNYYEDPDIDVYTAPHGAINSIASDAFQNTWFTSENGWIYCITKNPKKLLEFKIFQHPISALANSDGSLWLMHWGGVAKITDPLYDNARPTSLLPDKRLASKFGTHHFNKILRDYKGRIWASNWEGEIFVYDSMQNRFLRPILRGLPSDMTISLLSTMLVSSKNFLWVGTAEGICKFKIDESDPTGIVLTFERILNESHGLVRNGKPETFSFALLEDLHGNIWAAQRGGLISINSPTNIVTSYSMEDGLPTNAMVLEGGASLRNGFLAFSTSKGLVIFHPDSLRMNTKPPEVAFTNLLISNEPVPVAPSNRSSGDGFVLTRSITYETTITLPYKSNVIRFEFAALDFTSPSENEYAYKMVGFDNDWVYANSRRSATYTNLDPGVYTFRVKASNNDGVWNDQGTSIEVVILSPPWRTWWAYSLYSIVGIGVLLIARREIIKRERLRSEIKLKHIEAEKYHELDTLKSRFFANISHEFRTPLTLLLGPIEKRLSRATEPSDKKELSIMHSNASALLTLVNQLLDLSRLESGSLKLQCRQLNLNKLIERVSSQFASMADSRNITFQIEATEDVDLFVDAEKVEKIIINLLSNAFKFTSTNGSIQLIISKRKADRQFPSGSAAIIVKDTGIGIKGDDIPRIFDRFYQVDNTATRQYEGSGIGLALVKELVELHHGSIVVESSVGEGTSFTIHLPLGHDHLTTNELVLTTAGELSLEQTPVVSDSYEEVDDLGTGSSVAKLLIVEDNADLRYYLRSCLSDTYTITESQDGTDGYQKAVEQIPDLVVTDLMMPGMDGIELCKRLKANEKTSHIPIILLTAKADHSTKLEGLRTGADDYITKPFSPDELVTRVHNLITIRTNLQQKYARRLQLMPSEIVVESMDDQFMKKVMTIVERHLDDGAFGVEVLAGEAAMSNIQLYRKLKSLTGFTPNELIRNTRLERAASLLKQRAGNVADIAYKVGFNNLSYFSKCFKEKFGVSPSEYTSQKTDRV
jgi:signal transduction histidine kinase/ligand-binding sensor domain-containing protein/DNA-binding NarL/FixJ family response regulator